LASKIQILEKSLINDFGIGKPKIAVLGLNPHAGEDGLLGSEETNVIKPLIKELKEKGKIISGPYPADGFFGKESYKKFDAVLAMYHDQGLIPFKAMAFDTGVNFSAGFPKIRTSPDHGTAYDIAGKNKANESSFREAVYLALQLVKARKNELVIA
jgi:4-hydroxythreonine-4-phosphate dehydrogenase